MALGPGTRLGVYEILTLLGSGGMGEVWRARDLKLQRDVAIKVLPQALGDDPERLARFEREAQTLAALNHPHIAHIHGFEDSSGVPALVMELVEGPTLADRIARGPIPLDEALPIAKQIAEGLEAAHEQGIIHRDLKPANIKVREDGTVKILDFGLAKALEPKHLSGLNVTQSPTITTPAMMTGIGVILGTAAYMSPEQAKGRPADKRSDVWAFGCVLYEMLSRKRAFEGEDVSDTFAAILRGDPDWSALPPLLSPVLRRLLTECLQRDRQKRIGDIAVVRYVLDDLRGAERSPAPATDSKRLAWLAAAAAMAIGGGAAGWMLKPTPPAGPKAIVRFPATLAAGQAFSNVGRHVIAISPDGLHLAYVTSAQLVVRALDQLEGSPVRGTVEGPTEPIFSPDGQWIAYFANRHLRKVAVNGGTPITLAEAPAPFGASWTGDRILFGAGPDGIFEVPSTGGTPKPLIKADGKNGSLFHGPQLLPGGEAVLFTLGSVGSLADRWNSAQAVVQSLKTGERKVLVPGATDVRYVPSGHLLYARDGVLYANAFNLTRLELVGGPTAVLDGLLSATVSATGSVQVAIADNGTIAYPNGGVSQPTKLAWKSRQGSETAIDVPTRPYETPRISPDGTRIAVRLPGQDDDIWIWALKQETLTRLTFDKAADATPNWTRDGKRIVYVGSRERGPSIYSKLSDGTGDVASVLDAPPESSGALVVNSITPDNAQVVFSIGWPADIMTAALPGPGRPRPLIAEPRFAERGGDISPDGHWIAYYSDESGSFQVYVRPFPEVNSGRWQVSSEGGTHPVFSPAGHELFFRDDRNRLVSVPYQSTAGGTFAYGKGTPLFELSDIAVSTYRNWDPSPDGSRFVIVKADRAVGAPQITVILNWLEEVKQRVSTRR